MMAEVISEMVPLTVSTDSAAIALRKIDNIKQSKGVLSSVEELPSYTNVIEGPSRASRE